MGVTEEALREGAAARLVRELAVQDWIVGGHLTLLTIAVLAADPSPLRATCVAEVLTLAACVAGAVGLVRGGLVVHPIAAPLLFRFGVLGVVLSYFVLRDVLPVVNPHALDDQLHAFDVAFFGGEPAVWMDRFVDSATTEWFAFFYLCYFPLLACYVLPFMFFSDRPPLVAELGTGLLVIYCTGQLLYLAVPGWGPHRALADVFAHPLPRGPWFDVLQRTVMLGGAQKDIFPSLHTAGPLFLTLFAFRHRRKRPFCLAWPVTAFVTLNIIVATMFLRWHYAIDVVCGMLLALVAFVIAVRLPPWESARRRAAGLGPVWPPMARHRVARQSG